MEQMSVFTEYLQKMADYSAKTDAEKITKDDYLELQRMSSKIKVAYQKGDIPPREYRIISNLYECVKDAVRNYTAKYKQLTGQHMNLYKQLSDKHQKQVNDFLNKYAFFAFSDKQFRDGLQRLGITEEDAGKKLVRMSGTGGFMLRDHAQEYAALAESITNEINTAVHDPGSGPHFAYDMFYYELANHEYGITGSVEDTLDALGYTFEEVQQDDVLKTALEQAAQDVMQNTF